MTEVFTWILAGVLMVTNLVSVVLMGQDKIRAIEKRYRIRESTLFISALTFGGLGAVVGMFAFRHKTRHWYFVLGMPLILAAQTALIIFLFYKGILTF